MVIFLSYFLIEIKLFKVEILDFVIYLVVVYLSEFFFYKLNWVFVFFDDVKRLFEILLVKNMNCVC